MIKNSIRLLIILLCFSNILNAKDLEKVSIQLQWLDQFQFAGYYIAKEKGFYKDVNLDVEIKQYNYDISPIDEVINRKATYGVGRSTLIVEKSNGKNILLLASIFQSSPLILLSTKELNINTINDFKNKRIMLTPDSGDSASFQAMTSKYNIEINKDMIIQKHSFNIDDLINKKTDLMAAYVSNEPYLLEQKNIEPRMFYPRDYGFDFYSDILFTSEYEIKNHQKRAIRFKNASLKGWEYAFNHIEEAVDLILKKYNVQKKSKDALIYEAQQLKRLAYYQTTKLGKIDKNKIQRIYDIYNVIGLIKHNINIDDLIFNNNLINLSFNEKQYLKHKKEIKMCIDPNWMPFEKIDQNKHVGLSSDYIDIVQDAIGIPIVLVQTKDWEESVSKAKKRECDIFSMVSVTRDRKKYMDFTSPYLDIPIVIATKINKQFIDNIELVLNKKIGVVKSTSVATILKKRYPNINMVNVDSVHDGLKAVESGKIFAFINNLATINYEIQNNFIDIIKVSGRLNIRRKYSIATRNDEPQLHNIIEKVIQNIDTDTKEIIFHKWVNPTKERIVTDYTLIWQISSILAILIFIGIYRQNELNKYNTALEESKKELLKSNQNLQKSEHEIALINEHLELKIKEEVEKNRKKDQQIIHQSRLAQMGEMISMIAHQWRQPLNAISLTSSNLQFKIMMNDIDAELFTKEIALIDQYSQHLSKTIDDFRGFFKDNKVEELVTLEDVINSTLEIVRISVESKNIKIITNFDCHQEFKTYSNELRQVILNLIKNAEDILQEKQVSNATITIETMCDKNDSSIKCLVVRDNGGGIPVDIIDNIFNPYFSTKLEKDGAGLGLYMSKTIIEDHCKGKLSVVNDTDGAVFRIEL